MKDDRKPVYDALDALPDAVFAALLMAMTGVNNVMALTIIDNPAPNKALDDAMAPWVKKLGGY